MNRTESIGVLLQSLSAVKEQNTSLWTKKYQWATKRLLSSVFFFVSSKNALLRGNKMLPPIGYYYSIFHMSKSLLFLHPKYSVEELKNLDHKIILNLVKTEFIYRKVLSNEFLESFESTKRLRECVNYDMNSLMARGLALPKILKETEKKVFPSLEEGIEVFKILCGEDLWHVCTLIGDGIGDDWMDSCLSSEEQQDVGDLLLKYDLTT